MDLTERFLRRLALLDDIDVLHRESRYHRTHDDVEELPAVTVWQWDDPEGVARVVTE